MTTTQPTSYTANQLNASKRKLLEKTISVSHLSNFYPIKNQKYFLLAFAEVLDEKFQAIAGKFIAPLKKHGRCVHCNAANTVVIGTPSIHYPCSDYFRLEFD